MHRCLLALLLSAFCAPALADYDAISSRGADLTGRWTLNAALSDDVEKMLAERLEKERRKYARWQREEELARPPGMPADHPAEMDDPPAAADASRPRQRRPWQKRRDESRRTLLAISPTLDIQQQGTTMEIVSAVESRRVQAGTHTQVSMPEGQLADSNVGWSGEWFVIERKVRGGPGVVEKYRLLTKTDQLEYTMAWSGDTELSGIKARRVFDRRAGNVVPPDPAKGPVR